MAGDRAAHAPIGAQVTQCRHLDCQAARADELAEIADCTGEARYLMEALEIFRLNLRVRCRRAVPEPAGGFRAHAAG